MRVQIPFDFRRNVSSLHPTTSIRNPVFTPAAAVVGSDVIFVGSTHHQAGDSAQVRLVAAFDGMHDEVRAQMRTEIQRLMSTWLGFGGERWRHNTAEPAQIFDDARHGRADDR